MISDVRVNRWPKEITHPLLPHPPQLHLAEVSPTLLERVHATPRYDALMELKTHWLLDLRRGFGPGQPRPSPAEQVLLPAGHLRCIPNMIFVSLPFGQVCFARGRKAR